MKKSLVKGVALVAASVLGITGLSLAPANATTRTVAVVQETNTLTGLNTAIVGKNLVTNVDVLTPTGAGFTYWNNKAQLVRNTAFGTFKITKNVANDFEVTYTVKKGLKWSDGTLITGQDLLLSHALSSSKYSIAAGLGSPIAKTNKFNSAGYGGPYDDHTFADSYNLSDDNYSVTVKYDSFQPDWQIFGPGPTDVAALVALAKGKKTLQSARTNAAYKNLFEDAYYNSYDALPDSTDPSYQDALDARTASRALLISIATKWSTAFNITTVDSSTNPLLLISNGGFMVETITKQAATLKLNPLASVSGTPKMTGNLQNLVFAFPASKASFSDVAAAQALANKQIDAYSGAANAAVWQELSKNTSITKSQASSASYEHLDLRTGTSNTGANPGDADVSCPATYTGPFAGESQRAKDLRHAFLLVVPRQLIANTYVGRVFDPTTTANSPVLQSSLLLTTEGNYAKQVTGLKSYVDEFSKSQADRNALALTLVKKYYPNAGPGTNNISINYLRNTSDRRADINLQIKLEAAKVGFNVSNEGNGNWPDYLDCNFYDVADFAWSRSAISQTGNNANYVSTGGNNTYGWSDSAVDTSFDQFSLNLSATELSTASVNTEKLLYSHYWTLPLYQWPGVAAWNSDLKGVLYNPLNPNLVWNYWAWGY